jgi:hypothetical protein
VSGVIDRPVFAEGQILAAADLQSSQDHASGQMARHERGLHLWGIATGLALTKQPQSTAGTPPVNYVDVTLTAGMAVDGTGREIIVPTDTQLSESDFTGSNVATVGASATDWYPVFLIGRDAVTSGGAFGNCGGTAGGRTQEAYVIDFGRPGDAASLDQQTVPAVGDGPGSGAWRVLVGYVRWNGTIQKFSDTGTSDQGIGLRYVGVGADRVEAPGDSMTLSLSGAVAGGSFIFGVRGATGAVMPVMTLTAKGDLTAAGKVAGAVTPGSVQVQSGVANDGVILPLPSGVTEAMVAPGKGTVHVQLKPRIPASPPGVAVPWIGVPAECGVDSERRLQCLLRYFDPTGAVPFQEVPGSADYLVIVATAAVGGGP